MGPAGLKLWWQNHTPWATSLGKQAHRLMSPASSKLGQQATSSHALAGIEVLGSKSTGPWVLQAANKGTSQEPFGDNRPSHFIISLQEVIAWH